MKASGKSSFTTFVDLGMYQSPGGTGDNISVSGESEAQLGVPYQPFIFFKWLTQTRFFCGM